MSLSIGIVSFDPTESLVALCTSAITQGCRVRVVDNGSSTGEAALEACERAGADVMRLQSNTGVSGALAALLDAAGDDEWLLTFDQDSQLPSDFVDLLTGSAAVADPGVAVVGPVVRDALTSDVIQGDPAAVASYDVLGVITSGSLCRTAALREVGGVRADLFIDYVDWDLCLRLRSAGWRVTVEPSAILLHSLGSTRTHRVAGSVRVRASHHSADRQYYKYRNFLLLVRAGTLRGESRWAIRQGVALAWGPLKVLLFEGDWVSKLQAIAAGLRDGLRGRGGSRPTGGGGWPWTG